MKKLTPEIKAKELAKVLHLKSQAEGPRYEYLQKRRKSNLYEACKLPGKIIEREDIPEGVTPFVEPVLRETKKEAKPLVIDSVASEGRIAVAFRSRGWNQSTELNELITYNLNRLFLDMQDGKAIIDKTVDESLGPGSAFNKVYVSEISTKSKAKAKDWVTETSVRIQLADGWIIDEPEDYSKAKGKSGAFEWKTEKQDFVDPQSGEKQKVAIRYVKGVIPLLKIDKMINVDFVDSKDLWFDTSFADDFDKCRFFAHRNLTTVGEMEKLGFDVEDLKEAAALDKDEILAELSLNGINDVNQDDSQLDEKERKVYRWEYYYYSSDLDETGESKPYQMVSVAKKCLSINEIPRFPSVHAKKKNVLGCFYGSGFFDDAKPYQDALTKKYRIADQVASISAWPRYLTVKGQYNRESLLNHRPGAIVEQMASGSVDIMPKAQTLDQSFITSYEMLRESEKQSLRRGFGSANLEEIPPIATATVAMGLYADAQRGKELSRSYRDTYLIPLYKLIYETMKDEAWPLYDQNGQEVQGVEYPDLYDMTIDINTNGDDAAQTMQLQNAIQTALGMAQVQSPWFNEQNKYEAFKLLLERSDLDVGKLSTDPSTIPQDPHALQMQLELEALNHSAAKVNLQNLVLEGWNAAADVNKKEQEAQEIILKGAKDREVAEQESLARIQQIMNDAQYKADKNAIDNKRADYDALLGAAEKRHDNRVNGVM
ncbi:hypothetical protein G4E03_003466 [Salmonella enterica]|nr:hypothetical protein [Salmonella enterica]